MPDYFPVLLDVRERRCLVVGGGAIAQRKAVDLLAARARVDVVSPAVTPALAALAAEGRLRHRPRAFLRADVRGAFLVVAATGRPLVDDAVATEARRRGALVNVVDRPARCDFILPSVLRRGDLQIAVSTGGRCPALAREIRRRLETQFGAEYATLVAWAGKERTRRRRNAASPAARLAAGEQVAALALARAIRKSWSPSPIFRRLRGRRAVAPLSRPRPWKNASTSTSPEIASSACSRSSSRSTGPG
ncbi:MAG: bifunctional precorrin-2 dehydrogenase/sirohydrochlorin ferrochelatase [Candidatus Rokubacteria bacterium]|nr:bifunctional precorrin-2 dehydrogenase/sirohydrochlorin ferrochelatase [Candidatus Rokubacteria bacterium]